MKCVICSCIGFLVDLDVCISLTHLMEAPQCIDSWIMRYLVEIWSIQSTVSHVPQSSAIPLEKITNRCFFPMDSNGLVSMSQHCHYSLSGIYLYSSLVQRQFKHEPRCQSKCLLYCIKSCNIGCLLTTSNLYFQEAFHVIWLVKSRGIGLWLLNSYKLAVHPFILLIITQTNVTMFGYITK